MLNRLLLLLFVTLMSDHLLSQCNCDSIVKAQGYHVLTPEEIRKDPSLEETAIPMSSICSCKRDKDEPVYVKIHFSGKWGYVSLRTGVNYDELRVKGYYIDGFNFKFDRPRQNYISAAFDLDAPEWSGIVLRAEVAWKPQRFYGTMDTAQSGLSNWQIKANTIGRELSLLYKSTKGKLRWFVGAGLGKSSTRMKQNTWTDYSFGKPQTKNAIDVYTSNYFTSLSAGLMFLNRIEIRYKRIGTQWSTEPVQYSIKNKSNVITIGYRL